VRKLPAALLSLILILVAIALPARPQKAPPLPSSSRENERRSFATNVLRAINSSELDYKTKHGSYANWNALLSNGYFSEAGTKFISQDFPTVAHALYGSGPEIVPGWRLRLNISNNGQSYDALLEDVTDPKCGFAGLTDDRGVIRQSKSVDCPL
jgi:type II secretory pathway pseudopilin PulG